LLFLISCSGVAQSQRENLQELLNRKQYNQVVSFTEQLQASDSSDFQTMYQIGQAYEGLLRYRDAYRFYQHCLTFDSIQTDLLYANGRMAANLGRIQEAESFFLKIWEADTTDFYANYQLARFYVQIGNDKKAIDYYEHLLEFDPNNAVFLRAVGDCYYRLNERFSAMEAYWFAFQSNKENAGLASTLVSALLPITMEDKFERVHAVCDTALFYNPGNTKILQHKGFAYYSDRKYTEADSIFSYLLAQGDSSFYNVKFGGSSKYYAGKHMDAIDLLEIAYMEDDTDIEVCMLLGSALGRTYDRQRAFQLLDRVEELMNPNPALVNLLKQFRADTHFRSNQYREAAALYYQLWTATQRSDILLNLWSCYGRRVVNQSQDDDEQARSMFVNVLIASERKRFQNYDTNTSTYNTLTWVRSQLEKFREEMFFRGIKEYPMISPDNKRSTVTEARLQELIQQLPERP